MEGDPRSYLNDPLPSGKRAGLQGVFSGAAAFPLPGAGYIHCFEEFHTTRGQTLIA